MFDWRSMMSPSPERPTQKTKPKGKGKPIDIPVPAREDVMRDLSKLAPPVRRAAQDRDDDSDGGAE